MQGFGSTLSDMSGTTMPYTPRPNQLSNISFPVSIHKNNNFGSQLVPTTTNSASDLSDNINHSLSTQNSQLRRKQQNLDELKDTLVALEEFSHNTLSKYTLHNKMKDELTTKSYTHNPLRQAHQELLHQLEIMCQELTSTLSRIDQGDPKACNSILQDRQTVHKLKELLSYVQTIRNDDIQPIVDSYQTNYTKLLTRYTSLDEYVVPRLESKLNDMVNNQLPTTQSKHQGNIDQLNALQVSLQQQIDANNNYTTILTSTETERSNLTTQQQSREDELQQYQQFQQLLDSFHSQIIPQMRHIVETYDKTEPIITKIDQLNHKIKTNPIPQLESNLSNLNDQYLQSQEHYQLLQTELSALQQHDIFSVVSTNINFQSITSADDYSSHITHYKTETEQTIASNQQLKDTILERSLELVLYNQQCEFIINQVEQKVHSLMSTEQQIISEFGNNSGGMNIELQQFIQQLTPEVRLKFPQLVSVYETAKDAYIQQLNDSITTLQSHSNDVSLQIQQLQRSKNDWIQKRDNQLAQFDQLKITEQDLQFQINNEKIHLSNQQQQLCDEKARLQQSQIEIEKSQLESRNQHNIIQSQFVNLLSRIKEHRDSIVIPPPPVVEEEVQKPIEDEMQPPIEEKEVQHQTEFKPKRSALRSSSKVVSVNSLDSTTTTSTSTASTTKTTKKTTKRASISFNDTPFFQSPPQDDSDEYGDMLVAQNTLHNRNITQLYPDLHSMSDDNTVSSNSPSISNVPIENSATMNDDEAGDSTHDNLTEELIEPTSSSSSTTTTTIEMNSTTIIEESIESPPIQRQPPPAPKQHAKTDYINHHYSNVKSTVQIEVISDSEDVSNDQNEVVNDQIVDDPMFFTPPRNRPYRSEQVPIENNTQHIKTMGDFEERINSQHSQHSQHSQQLQYSSPSQSESDSISSQLLQQKSPLMSPPTTPAPKQDDTAAFDSFISSPQHTTTPLNMSAPRTIKQTNTNAHIHNYNNMMFSPNVKTPLQQPTTNSISNAHRLKSFEQSLQNTKFQQQRSILGLSLSQHQSIKHNGVGTLPQSRINTKAQSIVNDDSYAPKHSLQSKHPPINHTMHNYDDNYYENNDDLFDQDTDKIQSKSKSSMKTAKYTQSPRSYDNTTTSMNTNIDQKPLMSKSNEAALRKQAKINAKAAKEAAKEEKERQKAAKLAEKEEKERQKAKKHEKAEKVFPKEKLMKQQQQQPQQQPSIDSNPHQHESKSISKTPKPSRGFQDISDEEFQDIMRKKRSKDSSKQIEIQSMIDSNSSNIREQHHIQQQKQVKQQSNDKGMKQASKHDPMNEQFVSNHFYQQSKQQRPNNMNNNQSNELIVQTPKTPKMTKTSSSTVENQRPKSILIARSTTTTATTPGQQQQLQLHLKQQQLGFLRAKPPSMGQSLVSRPGGLLQPMQQRSVLAPAFQSRNDIVNRQNIADPLPNRLQSTFGQRR